MYKIQYFVLLLLIHSFACGSHEIGEEDISYSHLHATQRTITNLTARRVSIEFYTITSFHKEQGVLPYPRRYRLQPQTQHNPGEIIAIPQYTTFVHIAELRSSHASQCLINPCDSYVIQKSEVLMLVNETTGEIIPDRRDNKPYTS